MTSDSQLSSKSSLKKLSSIDLRRQAGEAVLAGVDKAISSRWQPAKDRAARLTGDTVDEKFYGLHANAEQLGTVHNMTTNYDNTPGNGVDTRDLHTGSLQ